MNDGCLQEVTDLLGEDFDRDPDKPLVVLMCGIAGSGKTTFSQKMEHYGYVRLSIDEEVWSVNGRYGIDYSLEAYRDKLDEAHIRLRRKIVQCIQDKRQSVVDSSFWNREERNEYKQLIENAGGQWRLIYLRVDPEQLRERLKLRSQRFDANAAFTITEELLTAFINGFEVPEDEGEIVIDN
ncbi:AAA family ATPase [Paenibacillus sp. MMS20-IR301]|uniref:AAA family ATPase n=1 Tax=Paenibacillus sp. MMS20-IR301 TaxID=2895946 RepID=UPI0028EB6C30|nr:AAA family ATPase [Paenibacillus sp. MMS20-IR301]WNS42317.1 AAA family ATPase [Paenibacillus sp. MMS20-IR301]